MAMTPSELARARATLGMTPAALALELNLSEATIGVWERGEASIPGHYATEIAWIAALKERQNAFAAAGLAPCPVMTALDAEPMESKRDVTKQLERRLKAMERHATDCQL